MNPHHVDNSLTRLSYVTVASSRRLGASDLLRGHYPCHASSRSVAQSYFSASEAQTILPYAMTPGLHSLCRSKLRPGAGQWLGPSNRAERPESVHVSEFLLSSYFCDMQFVELNHKYSFIACRVAEFSPKPLKVAHLKPCATYTLLTNAFTAFECGL